ncbi:hypothetical protein LUZ61_008296 [Rhynchospora tenuis]|uniref:Reverse transcriptase domain-containing protein n=1 Tax=Rhynchospora tenuis TaxID=198213 RepID=A0AAD6EXB1_9POAL|nr:hypothetical protein LUZ61_008296 [Rhynchospora tenuis]
MNELIPEDGLIPEDWLRCRVTLIPKSAEPQTPAEFRPISVGNVLYRLVMKMIANRLKPYLRNVISQEQNAFVKGRNIVENIILVKETLHSFSKHDFKQKNFMLKADVNKAFDKLDWAFLERAMRYLNIPEKIISLLLSSYKRAKVTITINGRGDGFIRPTQGLRQGCPMSPYVFIIAMEALSRWLQEATAQGVLKGVRVAHTSPILTHAIYADDLILMGDTSTAEVDAFVNIMHKFGYVSGLHINPSKSRLWFSKNCDDLTVNRVQEAWRATRVQHDEKYLGIMIGPRGDSKKNGDLLLEKMKQKLAGWKSNMLSHAGRLILIKSVLMTMPVYYMSIELLPKRVIKEINSLLAKFFWGKTDQNRYLAYIAWKKVCKPVDMGGLGVKDLQSFGEALFLKLVWSLMADEDKPWVKVCKAKYYPNVGYWRARNVTNVSKMWKQIMGERNFFENNVMWHIGDGSKAHALSQPWFQGWVVQEEGCRHDRLLRVKDLIDEVNGQWDMQKLNRLYQPHQVQQIIQGPNKPNMDGTLEDILIWQPAKSGKYTAKEGYNAIVQMQEGINAEQNLLWEGIWKNKIILPRIKIFLWRLINKGLPMAVHMHARFPNFSPMCQRCYEENEFDMHCLFFCENSRQVWFASPLGLRVNELPLQIGEALKQIMEGLDDYGIQLFTATIWEVWKERNKAVIEHTVFKPTEVLKRVQAITTPITMDPIQTLPVQHIDEGQEVHDIYENGWQVVMDASWDTNNRAGCAYIVYDGGLLHSVGMHSELLNDPFMAEAKALQESINYMVEKIGVSNITRIQFFSDCNNLVQAVNNCDIEQLPSWRARGLVNDIIKMMEDMQLTATLHFAHRDAVQQAHVLANLARRKNMQLSGQLHWQLQQEEEIRDVIDARFFQRVQQAPP